MMVEQVVDGLIQTMARNRRKHNKAWEKVRIDRLTSLVDLGDIDQEAFILSVITDERFKICKKFVKDGEPLADAVQLRYDVFRRQVC